MNDKVNIKKYIDAEGGLPTDGMDAVESALLGYLEIYHLPSKRTIRFRAILNNLSDEYEQRWSEEPTYGRMDDIETYQGTKRKISVSFTVIARSDAEAALNAQKISMLSAFQYPSFETVDNRATGIKEPPLVKVKFANHISHPESSPSANAKDGGLLCRMDGFKYELIDENMGFFYPDPGVVLPAQTKIDLNLTIKHTHSLGWIKGTETGVDGGARIDMREGGSHFPYLIKIGEESDINLTAGDDVPEEITDAQNMATSGGSFKGGGGGGFHGRNLDER